MHISTLSSWPSSFTCAIKDVDAVWPVERHFAAQHLVTDNPERIDIRTRVDAVAPDLLRGHILRRAYEEACLRQVLLLSLTFFTRPKSSTFTRSASSPCSTKKMFAGFKSR